MSQELDIRRRGLAARALDTWGSVEQRRQAAEECHELGLALRHFETGKVGIEAVAEEIAGVEIMLEQLYILIKRQCNETSFLDRARVAQLDKLERAIEADT